MLKGKLKCPKCGSTEINQIGTTRYMCQQCYEVFEEKKRSEQSPTTSSGRVKKCPYCMQLKPEDGFKNGICADCIEKYAETAKQSETEARIKQGKKDDIMEIASAVAAPSAYAIGKTHEESAIGSGRRGASSSAKFPTWAIVLIAVVVGLPVLFWIVSIIITVIVAAVTT
ncbi:hypothetical protein GF359_09495 [candidate division WOR-3 bacterium]|uniref:Uncharacterized protein n=1 Tax=candidate division WOR-3 bacterium TaxID=2052148 RepID=A0A9D5KAW3_UNCW3|nr:hypothetical protein [candidate division WOR-3 bacterium]MBD3365432.1 hypothetical protein [candidate division WOR-3 bacterium]